jgi:hypothetical protein
VPEGRGAFGGFIGPRTLVEQVRVAAPYLFDGSHARERERPRRDARRLHELAHHPLGWWEMLFRPDLLPAQDEPSPAARTDYFALCLAAHFASCATYVPTDVDAKIRHALWFEQDDAAERAHMLELAAALADWDVRRFSARLCTTDADPLELPPRRIVSGHDGERLSVLVGAMLASLAFSDSAAAERFEQLVDDELRREADAFLALERAPGRGNWTLLALAATLTHNVGDVNQSLESSSARRVGDAQKQRFCKLAQERPERYARRVRARRAALPRTARARGGIGTTHCDASRNCVRTRICSIRSGRSSTRGVSASPRGRPSHRPSWRTWSPRSWTVVDDSARRSRTTARWPGSTRGPAAACTGTCSIRSMLRRRAARFAILPCGARSPFLACPSSRATASECARCFTPCTPARERLRERLRRARDVVTVFGDARG